MLGFPTDQTIVVFAEQALEKLEIFTCYLVDGHTVGGWTK